VLTITPNQIKYFMIKSWSVLTVGIIIAIGILLATRTETTAAFGGGMQLPPGKMCTVQFRRGDALGSGAPLPVSPLAGNINGADTAVTGKLKAALDEWIVIEQGAAELWIPKASVLLIRFDTKQ
jgi:hypothetical protein